MTAPATSILGQAGQDLGAFLPRLAGALALLVIGLILARLIARVVLRALRGTGVDDLADRGGVTRVLQTSGLGGSLAGLLARAVRIFLSIVVVFAALSLLGLQFLSASLNQAILELPRLFIAAALVLGGAVVAGTFTLAFGLGSRDVARALSAGRYLRHDYRVGQDIAVGDVRGRITRIHSTTTTVDAGDGRSVRIPNHLLIASVVTVYGPEPEPDPAGGTIT